jgi:uncharacterized protein YxeA
MKYLLSTLISLVIAIVLALAISSYHKEKVGAEFIFIRT